MSPKKEKEESSSDESSPSTTPKKPVKKTSKESSSESSSEEEQKPIQKKKVQKKSSSTEEDTSSSTSNSGSDSEPKSKKKPPPKKKPAKKGESSESETSSESEAEKPQGKQSAPKPAGKGKAAAKKPQDDEIFAEFVEGDVPQKLTAAQLKRQRKKEAEAQAKKEAEARVEVRPAGVEVKSEQGPEEKTISASALKKQKQKEKEQAKKEAQGKALKEKLAKEKERRDKIEQAEKAKRDAELAAIKAAKDEEERLKREAEELKEAKRLKKEAKIAAEKEAGTYMTPAQRKRHQAAALAREQLLAQGNIKVKAVMDVVGDKVQVAVGDKGVGESADSAPAAHEIDKANKPADKPLKKKDKGKKPKNFGHSAEKEARIQEDAKRAQEAREAKKKADAEEAQRRAEEEAVAAVVETKVNEIEEEDDFVGPADVPTAPFDDIVVSASADDWEKVGAGDGDDVLDDWDMDSDQEREKEVQMIKKAEEKVKADEAAKKARAAAKKAEEEAKAEAEAKAAETKAAVEAAKRAEANKKKPSKKKTSNKNGSMQKGSNKKGAKPKKEKQEKCEEEPVPDDDDDAAFAKSRNTATGFVSEDDADEEILARFDESKRGKLRSPITCIMGHVDTGKTKILDKIRHTNVQDKEAGGITQQIGATYFPVETLQEQLAGIQATLPKKLVFQLPGLLVIDTPGHESFNNLRSRGSSLCDIAVLVVDIMHGLEPQTLESIGLLRMRKTPFIIALNKIDRLYSWKTIPDAPFRVTFAQQNESVKSEFDTRLKETIAGFAKEGLNVALYFDNKDKRGTYSIVPTSAITGEGIQDMLMLLVRLSQNMMAQRLTYTRSLQCTVLEVKQIDGLGTTIDVVLVNGVLREGDTIVLCGLQGPIVTSIRALLTPHPGKEMRVKGEYLHHKEVHAAMGVKICAPGLEHAVAGGQLLLQGKRDDLDQLKDQVQGDLATILSQVDRSGIGVCVQASTLGSLEAILEFFRTTAKIPVSGINIGPVHKKDVMRAAVMLERKPEYAIILAFDVKVQKDAQEWADKEGVKIFTADIIYHLFDKCVAYMDDIRNTKRSEASNQVVFPCVLDILPNHIFSTRAPIILGVKVTEGLLKIGTPLCVKIKGKDIMPIGRVTSIQSNHQEVQEAAHGLEVAVKIEQGVGEQKLIFGRHFTAQETLYSKLTRESIDLLKANFKEDVEKFDGWKLVYRMKPVLGVQ